MSELPPPPKPALELLEAKNNPQISQRPVSPINGQPVPPPGPGRPPGVPNKATMEFKEAVNNLIEFATPQMVMWLERVATSDPEKALELIYKFAQFGYPLLARTIHDGNIGIIPAKVIRDDIPRD